MLSVEDAIARTQGNHRTALQWFNDHAGNEVSWASMQEYSETSVRIVNQAKGIYKPADSTYALSVRQTLNSPYADRPILERDDGSWQYPYFQENPNPAERDREATNRGLVNCLRDGIPVGVLVQRTPKPGVTYDVLGLALVADWQDGYFILEGFGRSGVARTPGEGTAPGTRATYEKLSDEARGFDPETVPDERERQVAKIVRRRGQAKFRRDLIDAYEGRCAVTGCDALDALDAAHISPYRGKGSNDPRNGMMLRSDIHNLFDLGLLVIDAQTMTVFLSKPLRTSAYGELHGTALRLPLEEALRPSVDALVSHRSWAEI